ncbi:hypothetical protein QQM39_08365 [Streptomyces sp. DT2A-34]|uniref:hypothetical protein n=1 Tax=Streptomyces sp. DT2A-34 TaxID=3051182 RepID=UPI00265BFB08|nr:hypothetical protein [Streptomyces sp. DT2A-34]MDO0910864.1 hypothetical protein [Streptomyces sp. DT2A-34]
MDAPHDAPQPAGATQGRRIGNGPRRSETARTAALRAADDLLAGPVFDGPS